MLYIEAVLLPESDRSERLTLTGQLGSVMQESAKAARTYVVSHFASLGIEPNAGGVHIHVPAGAIPKDGPSAGVTMATALASLYSGYPVRNDTAMTGEITLTGMVLPVGGIKEKVLAARRAGLKRVILPKENEKDVAELPEDVRNSMEIEFADRIEDVLGVRHPSTVRSSRFRFGEVSNSSTTDVRASGRRVLLASLFFRPECLQLPLVGRQIRAADQVDAVGDRGKDRVEALGDCPGLARKIDDQRSAADAGRLA